MLFVMLGLLVDPSGPAAALLVGSHVTALAAFIRTRALKTAILQRFERYVPAEVVAGSCVILAASGSTANSRSDSAAHGRGGVSRG
jgi:hypothetical protein